MANEIRNTTFFVSCLNDKDSRGSYSEDLRWSRTLIRSHVGDLCGITGLSMEKDLIRSLMIKLEEISGRVYLKTAERTAL